VSGDGTADVIAGSPTIDSTAGVDTGAWFVWRGGATLTGTKTPDASLTMSGAAAGDAMGAGGARLAEVTGDTTLDLVVASPTAGASDTGAVLVFAGGATLSGNVTETARLTVTGATSGDRLGEDPTARWFTLRFSDVVGDPALDVIVPAPSADVGTTDTGAIYVWTGGAALVGSVAPVATLSVPGAIAGDRLSDASASIIPLDVSGDGRADVIAAASSADRAGSPDVGAIYVWFGGTTMTGSKAPDATLVAPGAAAGDNLADALARGITVDVADVTGDGTRDVIAIAPLADASGTDAGRGYLWTGGASLTGTVSATAVFAAPGATTGDILGANATVDAGDLLFLVDLTGDGKLDVLIGGSFVDVGGTVDAGAFFLWKGGAPITGTPAPTTIFTVPAVQSGDRLGS
jgi:hypothetical protein